MSRVLKREWSTAEGWRDTKAWLAEHGPGEAPPGALDFAKSEFFREPLPAGAVRTLAEASTTRSARTNPAPVCTPN